MALPEQDFISSELPTYHNVSWTSNLDRPPNLVIILEESLGAEFVGSLGGVDVTPELDQLSTQGIWFENLYATGTRSARGIEAVISGFTPTPARSVVKLPRSQREFFTIAALLKNRGYNTSFMYGGEANFDNMRTFFVGNGIDQIIEKKDFANPAFMGSWGICDGELFDRAHAEFVAQGDKPFFSLVFTSSNHSPFEFPEGDFDLHEAPRATVNNAVKYADHALGEFFRKARESDYWDNTLFLVVADHNSRVRGAKLVPVEYFHIPGLILGGSVEPLVVSRLTSQIDLIPTLLGQMGIDDANPATGYDIFRPEMALVPGRAIMQYNGVQAYMQGDRVVIMEMGKVPEVYHYNPELGLQRGSPDLALEKRALAYSIWSTTAYSQQLYRLPASS
jgi:phosphoglycerol transferase MdoB-like AlkP superfamily enzyme